MENPLNFYVRLLTLEQKDLLCGQEFRDFSFFNPIQDNFGNWVISEQEVQFCTKPEFYWIKDLPEIEYVEKPYNDDMDSGYDV
jgi:hypothetical protein